jgi:hypothetical protein
VRTNAVQFGPKAVFISASLLFGLSFILLYWLAEQGLYPDVIKYTALLYLVYAALAVRTYRAGLPRDGVRQLRTQYRILFAIVVLVLLTGSLLKNRAI